MCLRTTRYYTAEEETREAGVWDGIRGWAEASMIYTYLPTEDAPATVIHALRTKPLPTNQAPLLRENCYFDEADKSEGQQTPGNLCIHVI